MVIYIVKYTKNIYLYLIFLFGIFQSYGQFNSPRPEAKGKILSKRNIEKQVSKEADVITDSLLISEVEILSSPLDSIYVTSIYGNRYHPIKKKWTSHNGIDLRGKDKPVYAGITGYISEIGYDPGLGMYLKISNEGVELIYGHLSHLYMNDGQYVTAGDTIARTGKSGLATGKHLHFGLKVHGKYVDPILFLDYIIDTPENL